MTGSVLASSIENFTNLNHLATWTFDKYRRGYILSNAGLQMNAHLFGTEEEAYGSKQMVYAVQLNCAWAWPRQKRTTSPICLFLIPSEQWDPASKEVPTVFRRAGHELMTWDEASSTVWQDHGRHDIVILTGRTENASRTHDICYKTRIRTQNRMDLRFLSVHHGEKDGKFVQKTEGIFNMSDSGRYVEFETLKSESIIGHVAVHIEDGSIWETFLLLLKSTPRSLAFGIWKHASFEATNWLEEMKDLAKSNQNIPFPHLAVFSGNFIIRASAKPGPTDGPRGYIDILGTVTPIKRFNIQLVVEEKQMESPCPPQVMYGGEDEEDRLRSQWRRERERERSDLLEIRYKELGNIGLQGVSKK
ncbi:hypothetical protein BDV96DRAFT_362348 [Lophiotrema nucula]|uniref:Uncharacterized protein n=1 Tax=Lophiotrema nucula TaxID=690887 RepID=A0A6A5ZHS2_9PLEO|nr:hypothetical protein BDV96DRAFT_362348 [Lophiotrema nucula]